jgi:hypothetical protein
VDLRLHLHSKDIIINYILVSKHRKTAKFSLDRVTLTLLNIRLVVLLLPTILLRSLGWRLRELMGIQASIPSTSPSEGTPYVSPLSLPPYFQGWFKVLPPFWLWIPLWRLSVLLGISPRSESHPGLYTLHETDVPSWFLHFPDFLIIPSFQWLFLFPMVSSSRWLFIVLQHSILSDISR